MVPTDFEDPNDCRYRSIFCNQEWFMACWNATMFNYFMAPAWCTFKWHDALLGVTTTNQTVRIESWQLT